MKRQLSRSDVDKLNAEIMSCFGVEKFFEKKDRVSIADVEHHVYVVRDDLVCFFYHEGKLVPSLRLLLQRPLLKQVVVDMGAIKFVSSGADVMRPGIVELDHNVRKDDLVVVVDQTHRKPLCVAQALFSGEEIFSMKQGKVLRNLHWVGDPFWNAVP